MQSVINFIYYTIVQSGPLFHKNERFSDIFFDKFKNLLDDYIVNYQIKYFFYLLFISFFYLELSEGMFQLLHNYSPYHLSLFGSFVIDLCFSLYNIAIIDFAYSYFAFNVDAVGYILSLSSNHEISFSMVIMAMVTCMSLERYETTRHIVNVRIAAFLYFIYSFLFFVPFYLGMFPLTSYVFSTLIVILYCLSLEYKLDGYDRVLVPVIFLMTILPYYVLFSLLLVVFYFYLSSFIPIYDRSYEKFSDMNLTLFGNLLMIGVLGFFIIPLEYAYGSVALFIINSLPLCLAIAYYYKDEMLYPSKDEYKESIDLRESLKEKEY